MMSLIMSLITIIAFVLLAGAQTAAVRAGSMATIALIARANLESMTASESYCSSVH